MKILYKLTFESIRSCIILRNLRNSITQKEENKFSHIWKNFLSIYYLSIHLASNKAYFYKRIKKKKLSRYQPFEAIMKSRLKWINDKFYS